MRGIPETGAMATFSKHHPAINTEARVTLAVDEEQTHVLDWIHGSFHTAPNGAKKLSVEIGGVEKWAVDITAAGPFEFSLDGGLYGSEGDKLEVILAADDNGAYGKINTRSR